MSDDLARIAQENPEGIALIEPRSGREITWAEFDQWADRVGQTLLGRGLLAGQRVALVMANGIDLCVAYYGVLRCGMVAVPINPRSTVRELSRMVGESAPKLVVADAQSITQVRQAETGDATIVVHRAAAEEGEIRFADLLAKAVESKPFAPKDPELLAVVMFTAGATAKPRGVMLSHRALIANIDQLQQIEPPTMEPDDVVLGLLPMFHVYGLNCILGNSVRVGAKIVLLDAFDPSYVLEQIVEHHVTDVPIAPAVISRWVDLPELKESLASVRRIISGATTLDPELAEKFREASGHPVEQGYGLTETSPVITTTFVDQRDAGTSPVPSSVGRPIPGVEIDLRDALGGPATPGDPAQIWVRVNNLFSGYWPHGSGGPGPDGWWFTGDLGVLDENNELYLVERMGEKITVSGFGVYPSEVEEVLLEVPGVDQVAVIAAPHEVTGEAIVAFVVAADPDADSDALTEALSNYAAENLARFKRPGQIVVVAGLPHSPSGKVAKGRLRAIARDLTESNS